jgi:integrase
MSLELYLRGRTYWVRGRPADSDEYVRESLGTSDEALAQAAVRKLESAARKRRILGDDAPKPEDDVTFMACVLEYTASPADARYLIPITKKIGSMRVKEITPTFVRALARQMFPDAATDTWQRQVVTPVRSVINNSHELGHCPPIRIKGFTKKERVKQDVARGKQSRVPKVPGSWPWLLAFKEKATPRDAALAHFMFRHGYRVTQSVEMTRRDDMDLSAGMVRVHASKGHEAHWVELDPEEVAMIANLPLPYRGTARDRVFTITSATNGALRRRWKTACKRAGIPYLSPHAAGRHGYGTEMIVRQRMDPVSAAKDLWSDPSVMLKTYAHSDDAKARVREAFMAGQEAARTNLEQPQLPGDKKAKA